jgi:hypothetical protein
MAHPAGFFNRVFQNLLGAWREIQFATPVLASSYQAFYNFLNTP